MIIVIDNYDSFTYNLVHLVGAHTDDIEVIRNDVITVEQVLAKKPAGILISPGPGRPDDAGISKALIKAAGTQIPILGVCLGHQSIGEVFGAKVDYAPKLMHGKTSEILHNGASIFKGLENGFTATRYHSLIVDRASCPDCLEITAETADGIIMGLKHKEYPIEGIQFHPESILTTAGASMIKNWLEQVGMPVGV
ncbi:MAG: aminodeoxychorismate/anthranilate synthase component II [Rhodothermales bacterium]